MSATRYETEQEILDDIAKTLRRIQRYREKACNIESLNRFLIQKGDGGGVELAQMKENARKIEYFCMRAQQLDENDLRVLKDTLAEFRTPQLQVVDNGDTSVEKPKRFRPRKKKISSPATVPSEHVSMHLNDNNQVHEMPVSERHIVTDIVAHL